MKTVVMYVGDWKGNEIHGYFNQLINDLWNEGIEVLEEQTSETLMVIQTPRVYISFVDDLHKLEGRLFDQVFGNIPEKYKRCRLKDPMGGLFNGSLLEYVVSVEFGERR